jgi:hypothetical protein
VAKKSREKELEAEVEDLNSRIKAKNEALGAAKRALFAITREDPVKYPVKPGGTPTFVQAFRSAQTRAAKGLADISDAEEGDA